jgi:hypothetical protein
MDVQVGYNHSVRYALDGVVVTLGFNANALFRKITNYGNGASGNTAERPLVPSASSITNTMYRDSY